MLQEYKGLMVKLAVKPDGIEHIYEIRDWMETIPMTVRQQDELTRRYMLVIIIFIYKTTKIAIDFYRNTRYWIIFGTPCHKKILN